MLAFPGLILMPVGTAPSPAGAGLTFLRPIALVVSGQRSLAGPLPPASDHRPLTAGHRTLCRRWIPA
jgi:hypothetical protein